jgi:hypothetical protein
VESRARVAVTLAAGGHLRNRARVYLAVAANESHSQVGSGENAGRHLTHVAVVRTLEELGTFQDTASFRKEVTLKARPEDLPNLRVIAFVQDSKSLEVLGAAALPR